MIFIALLIIANVLIWKNPFPFINGNWGSGVSLYNSNARGAPNPIDRFRLCFAYIHPYTVGDIFAIATICIALSGLLARTRIVVCSLVLLGVWMADARIAFITVVLVLSLLGIKRAKPTVQLLAISLVVLLLIVATLTGYFDSIIANTMAKYSDRDISTLDGRTAAARICNTINPGALV